LTTNAGLAATAIVRAQDTPRMDDVRHMHGGETVGLTHPGQEAFGTIHETVRILEADPKYRLVQSQSHHREL
jgi:hypothetical protein